MIELIIKKGPNGYTVGDEKSGTVDMFEDSDEGRSKFIKFLVDNLLNAEIPGGRKYS